MKKNSFDYVIDEAKTWPPYGKPQPPYGPTTIEIIRSCPLRSCFEASQGYERRLGFAARVGTAFHRTLQSLMETPPSGSINQVAENTRQRFDNELAVQLAEVANRPREQGLPRDTRRINLAIEAAIAEALRVARENRRASPRQKKDVEYETIFQSTASDLELPDTRQLVVKVETEVPVQSRNRLFNGRVDRAEYWEDGVRLIDYKSALRDDLPGRYERQLQLYAYMWHETRAEWPVGAQVCYPLTGSVHNVSVKPEICNHIAEDAEALVSQLENTTSHSELATQGNTCQVCEFRPWCRPFWKWQNAETSHSEALKRAVIGLEGRVESITNANHYWKLRILWRNTEVQLVAPVERFPQLHKGHPGMVIRILDAALQGLRHAPNVVISELSEVFWVANSKIEGNR